MALHVLAAFVLSLFSQAEVDDTRWRSFLDDADKQVRIAHTNLKEESVKQNWMTRTAFEENIVRYISKSYDPPFHQAISRAMEIPERSSVREEAAKRSATWALNLKGMARQVIGSRLIQKNRNNGQPMQLPRWVTVEEAQQSLPKNSLLIEFVKFKHAGKEGRLWYAAWLIPSLLDKEGRKDALPIRYQDLGDAAEAEKQAKDLHEAISRKEGIESAELLPKLAKMKKTLLGPFPTDQLEGRECWFLSPAADIWLVPFAALPIPNDVKVLTEPKEDKPYPGKWYEIEDHTISYLLSGRDVVLLPSLHPPASEPANRTDLFLVGNPAIQTPKGRNQPPAPTESRRAGHLFVKEVNKAGPFGPNKGFANVAEAVMPLFSQADARLGTKATEEAALSPRGEPAIAVFCTHGFYLPLPSKELRAELPFVDHIDPLMRCGLILVPGDKTLEKSDRLRIDKDDPADGILTSTEIVERCKKFTRTELVVLVACQTAPGQTILAGDSLASLRHAFQMVGARLVVATSWEIPLDAFSNDPTVSIVKDFFGELQRGGKAGGEQTTYEQALRKAQLNVLYRNKKDEGPRVPPRDWAAFSVTGYYRER